MTPKPKANLSGTDKGDKSNEGGSRHLIELERENIWAYQDLTKEEKDRLVAEFQDERDLRKFAGRLTQRGPTHDINVVCKKVDTLVRVTDMRRTNIG